MTRVVLFLFSSLLSVQVLAKGVSPYLPLNLAPEVELQLQKLIALSGQTPLTKPYKASELLSRLPVIKDSHPVLHQRLSAYLKRYTQKSALTHRAITISDSDDNERILENNRGVTHKTSFEVSAAAHYFITPYFYVAGGGQYSDDSGRSLLNTHFGFGTDLIQVDIGYRDHWFSPFQDSAMLISTQAENAPSITFSNATPITNWNIRYEAFYSRLDKVQTVTNGVVSDSDHPRLTGAHVSASPMPNLSVGISRTYLYGGGERSNSLGNFFKGLITPSSLSDDGDNGEEGYEQTALSAKWNVDWITRVSIYAEFAEAGSKDTELTPFDTYARSYGFFLPEIYEGVSFRYEYTNRDSGWYVNGFYPSGFSNKDHILGHWSSDEYPLGDSPSAKSHHLLLDWELFDNQIVSMRISGQEVDNLPDQFLQDTYQVKTRYSFATKYGFLGLEGTYGKDALGDYYHRVSGFFRW